jgi:tetratricopeptide (TPR) repeat protein
MSGQDGDALYWIGVAEGDAAASAWLYPTMTPTQTIERFPILVVAEFPAAIEALVRVTLTMEGNAGGDIGPALARVDVLRALQQFVAERSPITYARALATSAANVMTELQLDGPGAARQDPAVGWRAAVRWFDVARSALEASDQPVDAELLAAAGAHAARARALLGLDQPPAPAPAPDGGDDVGRLRRRAAELHAGGRLDEALELYDHIRGIDRDDVDVWVARGDILVALARREGRDADALRAAVDSYGAAVERDAERPAAWAGLAEALVGLEQWQEADACATEALRLDPTLDRARQAQAQAQARHGNTTNRPPRR